LVFGRLIYGKSDLYDGQAKTREAKLGCAFTQSAVDKEGRPVRDDASTSCTGAIETAEAFGWRIYKEAKRRGVDWAREITVLGDDAIWIWNIANEHFPGALQVVDPYHAREHYGNVAKACLGRHKDKMNQWMEQRRIKLEEGNVEEVIVAIKKLMSRMGAPKDLCEQ
jgi:hypothetical protein